jgi:hypothetical protein
MALPSLMACSGISCSRGATAMGGKSRGLPRAAAMRTTPAWKRHL